MVQAMQWKDTIEATECIDEQHLVFNGVLPFHREFRTYISESILRPSLYAAITAH